MSNYFNADNCEFTEAQMEWANARVAELLAEMGDAEGENSSNVANACSRANDEMPCELLVD